MENIRKQEITICVSGNKVMWIKSGSEKHYEVYGDYVVKGKWYPADNNTVWTALDRNKEYCENCHYRKSYNGAVLVSKKAIIAAIIAWLVPIVGALINVAVKVL